MVVRMHVMLAHLMLCFRAMGKPIDHWFEWEIPSSPAARCSRLSRVHNRVPGERRTEAAKCASTKFSPCPCKPFASTRVITSSWFATWI